MLKIGRSLFINNFYLVFEALIRFRQTYATSKFRKKFA